MLKSVWTFAALPDLERGHHLVAGFRSAAVHQHSPSPVEKATTFAPPPSSTANLSVRRQLLLREHPARGPQAERPATRALQELSRRFML